MKKTLTLVLALMLSAVAYAQDPSVTATLSTTSCPAACATLSALTNRSTATISVTGTWTGALTALVGNEATNLQAASVRNVATKVSSNTITTNGLYVVQMGGSSVVRVQQTTATSGSPVVKVSAGQGDALDGSTVTQPVSASALPLPAGASTEAKQDVGNASISSLDGKVSTLSTIPVGTETAVATRSVPMFRKSATFTYPSGGNWTFDVTGAKYIVVDVDTTGALIATPCRIIYSGIGTVNTTANLIWTRNSAYPSGSSYYLLFNGAPYLSPTVQSAVPPGATLATFSCGSYTSGSATFDVVATDTPPTNVFDQVVTRPGDIAPYYFPSLALEDVNDSNQMRPLKMTGGSVNAQITGSVTLATTARLQDGSNFGTIRGASSPAIATDTALVVAVSPNNTPVLPSGASTEATLSSLNGKVTAVNTGAVVVSSSALPSGAATGVKQDTGNTSLASVASSTATMAGVVNNDGDGISGVLFTVGGVNPDDATAHMVTVRNDTPSVVDQAMVTRNLPSGVQDSRLTNSSSTPVVTTSATPSGTDLGLVVRNIPSGTQPISAASLPLPTDAATSANQATAITSLQAIADAVTNAGDPINVRDTGPVEVFGTVDTTNSSNRLADASCPGLGCQLAKVVTTTPAGTEAALVTRNIPSGTQATSLATLPALTAGSAVIGHVIADSGSTTAVTGNVTAVQATGTNLHAVIDSGSTTAVTGNVTVIQGTGSNLHVVSDASSAVIGHVVADSGSTTAVTQATGSNLHAVIDSGTVTANAQAVTTGTLTFTSGVAQTIAVGSRTGLTFVMNGLSGGVGTTYTVNGSAGSGQSRVLSLTRDVSGVITQVNTITSSTGGGIPMSGAFYVNVAGFDTITVTPSGFVSGTVTFDYGLSNVTPAIPIVQLSQNAVATAQFHKVTDGTNTASVKAASTLPALTDVAMVTTQRDPLPAGTNVIGHVINDAGSAVIGHVIADSGSTTAVTQSTGTNLHAVTDTGSTTAVTLNGVAVSVQQGVSDTGTARVTMSQESTYSAGTAAKTGTAAGTAAFFEICGSASKTVRIQRISVSGTVATTAVYGDVVIRKTSSAGTGATSTTLTNTPYDSNSASATATVKFNTVLPTGGNALVGVVFAQTLFFPITGTPATFQPQLTYLWRDQDAEAPTLRGTAQCVTAAFGTTTTNAPTLSVSVAWTEK